MNCLNQAYGQAILPSYDLQFVLSMLQCQHESPLDAEYIATIGVESVVMTARILLTQGYMRLDSLAKRNLQHKQPEHLQGRLDCRGSVQKKHPNTLKVGTSCRQPI